MTVAQTTKMIYATASVANMICGKLLKRFPERQYTVMKVSTGHQVVGITKLPDYMPPAKPKPVNNETFASASSTSLDALVFEFPYHRETKAWWYFDGGDVKWLHKNHCIAAEIIEVPNEPTMIRLKVSKKIAIKQGLAA